MQEAEDADRVKLYVIMTLQDRYIMVAAQGRTQMPPRRACTAHNLYQLCIQLGGQQHQTAQYNVSAHSWTYTGCSCHVVGLAGSTWLRSSQSAS